MKKQLILCWCIAILLLTSVSAKADPFFMGLGRLPGLMYSEARGVSGDGSVVVGSGDSGQTKRAFRWTLDGGMVQLADLPGGSLESEARGVSGDGSVVVGGSGSASGREATRWTQDGQAAGLGDLPGGSFYSFGLDASYDGSVVVGFSSSYLDREAFRWTENGGMLGLGYLSGHSYASYAYGVSDDGLVVVGHGISPATATQAFLWTQDSGMAGLGYLPGGNSSTALDVSGDGSFVAGYSSSFNGTEAFLWTQDSGMLGLGGLSGGPYTSRAYGVSRGGTVVVGSCDGIAFLWDSVNGMQSLEDMLIDDLTLGSALAGWKLSVATAISDDGSTIVGYGRNPWGYTEAWIANIGTEPVPEPATMLLLGSGLLGLAGFRRRSSRGRELQK